MKTLTKFKSSKLNLLKETVLSFSSNFSNSKGGGKSTSHICDILGR